MENNSAELFADLFDENDDVRELTQEEIKLFKPFSELPKAEQEMLLLIEPATSRPTRTVHLAAEVVERFEENGQVRESKIDDALREWLREHAA